MRGDKATFFKIVKGFILVKSSIKYLETAKAETFSNPFCIVEEFSCKFFGKIGSFVWDVKLTSNLKISLDRNATGDIFNLFNLA